MVAPQSAAARATNKLVVVTESMAANVYTSVVHGQVAAGITPRRVAITASAANDSNQASVRSEVPKPEGSNRRMVEVR